MLSVWIASLVVTGAAPRVAYVGIDGRLQVLDAGTTRTLGMGRQPRWSPDGVTLAYWEEDEGRPSRFGQTPLFRVPARGGKPASLASGEATDPQWSLDGSQVWFLRRREGLNEVAICPGRGAKGAARTAFRSSRHLFGLEHDGPGWVCHDQITVFRLDGQGRVLAKLSADAVTGLPAGTYAVDRFVPRPGDAGQWVYTSRVKQPSDRVHDEESAGVYAWDASTGQRRLLTEPAWFAEDPAWAPDGKSLVFSAKPEGPYSNRDPGIYQMAWPDGKPVKIASGREPSLSR